MELDKLVVKIEADLSSLKKGLAQAQGQIKQSNSGFESGFKRANDSLNKFSSTALKVGGVLAVGLGAVAIKNIAQVGMEIENLTVRLQALFGSAEEGSKAFETMLQFASKVPFTLQEIQRGAGSLAVVSADSEELAKNLEITGNIAAVTGLDFKSASEQIQRSLSSGIASADMFRERGVTAMLGFEQGARVTVEETEKKLMEVFGPGGKFGQASNELAKTLTGTLSMIGDKFFKVQTAISDGFFAELKAELREFDRTLAVNEQNISAYGNVIGSVIADAIRGISNSIGAIGQTLKVLGALIISTFATAKLFAFLDALRRINTAMKTTSALTMLTGKGFTELVIKGGVTVVALDQMDKMFARMDESVAKANKTLEEQRNIQKGVASAYNLNIRGAKGVVKALDEMNGMTKEQKRRFEELKDITSGLKEVFDGAGDSISQAFGDAIAKGQDFKSAMVKIFQDVISQIVALIVQLTIVEPMLDRIRASIDSARTSASRSGGGILDVFTGTLGNIAGDIFGGVMANGGMVAPGVAYTVGERGVETFVPQTAGTIIPNDQMGGVTINQNISFSTGVVPTVRAEVMNLLPTIKQQTVNAVAETRQRGGAFARTFGA